MDISTEKNADPASAERIRLFAELLSCGDRIPLAVYNEEGELLRSSTGEPAMSAVFENSGCLAYMREHFLRERVPLILSSYPGLLWCAAQGEVQTEDGTFHRFYVVGPVTNRDISQDAAKEAARKMDVKLSRRSDFIRVLQEIPVVPPTMFFQYAVMLHYCASGEKRQRSDIAFQESGESENTAGSKAKHRGIARDRNTIYRNEQRLLDNVRQGNLDYASSLEMGNRVSGGVNVSTGRPLEQMFISAVTFTSLCTRAAIEGGLPPDTAYTVGDSYIESLTACTNVTDMRAVNHAMYRDFIERVHKLHMSPSYSKQVASCINYIEMNLTEELSIKELADRAGYTEYYLSHKFKEETGITVGGFIRRARIERAKSLLANTDLPVNRIAEELKFCSSSYFSAKFEEAAGMLPNQYRREKQRI